MKKYFLFGLMVAIMPNLCCGASARYTQLVREKQQKMEELEKCMGSSNGLKIAGISTLGLTAVGVAGNIYEAKEIKKNVATIDENNTAIEKKEKENKKLKEQKDLLNECKDNLESAGAQHADKIATVRKNGKKCIILTCEKDFNRNANGTDCEPKTTKEVNINEECATYVKAAAEKRWNSGDIGSPSSDYERGVFDDVTVYNRYERKLKKDEEDYDTQLKTVAFTTDNKEQYGRTCSFSDYKYTLNPDDCMDISLFVCNEEYYECMLNNYKEKRKKELLKNYIDDIIKNICEL